MVFLFYPKSSSPRSTTWNITKSYSCAKVVGIKLVSCISYLFTSFSTLQNIFRTKRSCCWMKYWLFIAWKSFPPLIHISWEVPVRPTISWYRYNQTMYDLQLNHLLEMEIYFWRNICAITSIFLKTQKWYLIRNI